MKKILTLLISTILIFSISAFAFADETTGTITIDNPIAKQSYYVYRIFDLESYDSTSNAYSYILNDTWDDFALQDSIRGKYITLEEKNSTTYVNWIDGADIKEFSTLALAWAKANNIMINDGKTPTTSDPLVFDDLKLGYYLIDSSVGALCSITTTNPSVHVKEKNDLTTVEKKVKENSSSDYAAENSARIGETVEFKSEITLGEGIENLILHDQMDNVFTLNKNSFKLYVGQAEIAAANYTVICDGLDDDCTFEISFNNDYLSTLPKGTIILVQYSAVLNENAKISTYANSNTAWVGFGDDLTSTTSTTKTYTYSFDILKVNDKSIILNRAEFYLYDSKIDGNIIPVVAVSENDTSGEYTYRVAVPGEVTDGKGSVIKAGKATINGLDNKTYYLEETKQPAGYNKLSERVAVDMTSGSNNKADITGITLAQNDILFGADASNATGGIRVINKAGTQLPSTGGMGTVKLYFIGILLLSAAATFVIAKRRTDEDD